MSKLQSMQPGTYSEDRAEKLAEMVEPTMVASIWLGAGGTLALLCWTVLAV